jgi:hypothetical protein
MSHQPLRRNPAPECDFDWMTDGASDSGSGFMFLKPDVNASVYAPSWKGTETILRAYPSLTYDNTGNFEPYRLDAGNSCKFSNFLRCYDVAWKVGDTSRPVSFLVNGPRDQRRGYDPDGTPLGVLYRRVSDAVRDAKNRRVPGPSFAGLLDGGDGRSAPLPYLKRVYLLQGLLLVHQSNYTYASGGIPPGADGAPACVFAVVGGPARASSRPSNSAGATLMRLFNERNPDFDGADDDFENRFLYGDPVNPASGRFIHFCQTGVSQKLVSRGAGNGSAHGASAGWRDAQASAAARAPGGSAQPVFGYDVWLSKDALPDGTSPVLSTPEDLQMMRSQWLYWEQALHFPDNDEQAAILNRLFPAEALIFAWQGSHRHWIAEETWAAYRGSVSVQAQTPAAITAPSATPAATGWRQGRQAGPQQEQDLVDFPPREENLTLTARTPAPTVDVLRPASLPAATPAVTPAATPAVTEPVTPAASPSRRDPRELARSTAAALAARRAAEQQGEGGKS